MRRRLEGCGSSTSYQRERLMQPQAGFDMPHTAEGDELDRITSHACPGVELLDGFAQADAAWDHAAALQLQSDHKCCIFLDVDMEIEPNQEVCDAMVSVITAFRNTHLLELPVFWLAALSIIHAVLTKMMIVPSEGLADSAKTLWAQSNGPPRFAALRVSCRHSWCVPPPRSRHTGLWSRVSTLYGVPYCCYRHDTPLFELVWKCHPSFLWKYNLWPISPTGLFHIHNP